MWPISLFIGIAIGIALMEVPHLRKHGSKKGLWVFFLLLAVGVILNSAQAMQIPVPNPAQLMETVFKPMSNLVFQFLQ